MYLLPYVTQGRIESCRLPFLRLPPFVKESICFSVSCERRTGWFGGAF